MAVCTVQVVLMPYIAFGMGLCLHLFITLVPCTLELRWFSHTRPYTDISLSIKDSPLHLSWQVSKNVSINQGTVVEFPQCIKFCYSNFRPSEAICVPPHLKSRNIFQKFLVHLTVYLKQISMPSKRIWHSKCVCCPDWSLAVVRNDLLANALYLFLCPRLKFCLMLLVTEVTNCT